MDDVPIPGVDAVANWALPPPPQLRERAGAIKYVASHTQDRCEDCKQNMYDAMMAGARVVPPVANVARYKRNRGTGNPRYLCVEHTQARKLQER